MKIALASTSEIKRVALSKVFGKAANIICYDAPSGVNDQPINEETFTGAQNRLEFIKAACPDADYYVSIENGVFTEKGGYIDRAVVSIYKANGQALTLCSDGLLIPDEIYNEARMRAGGFAKTTVGQILYERGIVQDANDPHKDLDPLGRSRGDFITKTAINVVKKLR